LVVEDEGPPFAPTAKPIDHHDFVLVLAPVPESVPVVALGFEASFFLPKETGI
jgi:hypothetical protein